MLNYNLFFLTHCIMHIHCNDSFIMLGTYTHSYTFKNKIFLIKHTYLQ